MSYAYVGSDGPDAYASIQAAVDAAPDNSYARHTIVIPPGEYHERVVIPASKRRLTLRGADPANTIISDGAYASQLDPDGRQLGTFGTPTVMVQADDFHAEGLTFANSAGRVGQALALTVMGDRAVFRNCVFTGWQDTLLTETGRHYFESCRIEGATDFIFGGSISWFENCEIVCLGNGYITAASTPADQPFGYIFNRCTITGADDDIRTYFGRPWRDAAATVFMNCELGPVIRPEGWHNWGREARETTSRYAEFNNTGPGANLERRVPWAEQLAADQAAEITIENVLAGWDGWNPVTGSVERAIRFTRDTSGDPPIPTAKGTAYLATAETHDGKLALLRSSNGFDWEVAVVSPFASETPVRDPAISRMPSGEWQIVWTTRRTEEVRSPDSDTTTTRTAPSFGHATSSDLRTWSITSEHHEVNTDPLLPALSATTFDFLTDPYTRTHISAAVTLPRNYFQCYEEPVDDNPRLFHRLFSPVDSGRFELLCEPGYASTGVRYVGRPGHSLLIHVDRRAPYRQLRMAECPVPMIGPYWPITDPISPHGAERPSVVSAGDDICIFFRFAESGSPGLLITRDFLTFRDASHRITHPEGIRFGTVITVPTSALDSGR